VTTKVRLAFVNGPEDGNEVRVALPAVFGRLPDNDVPLPYDSLASRRHARLSKEDDRFVLEDVGSRNGTFLLTGEPLRAPTALLPGDLFRVGGIWFRFGGEEREEPGTASSVE
jgi:pSer/pThr/pTyr-binding forkhead associated (FHA) protein